MKYLDSIELDMHNWLHLLLNSFRTLAHLEIHFEISRLDMHGIRVLTVWQGPSF